MSRPVLVLVEWDDSRQASGAWRWLADYAPQGAVPCISVGWLVAENESAIALAASIADWEAEAEQPAQVAGVLEIPRRAVRRVVPVSASPSAGPDPAAHPGKERSQQGSSPRPRSASSPPAPCPPGTTRAAGTACETSDAPPTRDVAQDSTAMASGGAP